MFAGPNGSGKSTLKTVLRRELLGVFVNPDEIERDMRLNGFLDFGAYDLPISELEVKTFFRNSEFLAATGLAEPVQQARVSENRLYLAENAVNSYVASVVSDLIRRKLLDARMSFTLETVMSHPSKVELLVNAQRMGYRTYLYFIATGDPVINTSRVKMRARRGGHAVPEDRIVKRYHASLALLIEAIRHTNRAYIFDNSGEGQEKFWLAEITDGRDLEMKTDKMPAWFKHSVYDRIVAAS